MRVPSLAAVLAMAPALLVAQEVTGNISGIVVDPTGAAIPNASVIIKDASRNQVMKTIATDGAGEFTATLLPLGTYSISAEANGFKQLVKSNIELHVNDRLNIRMELQIGATSEQVTVEATTLQVETQSPAASSLISGTEVRELALNNRNYTQLIGLMPGVTNNSPTDENYIGTTNPLGSTNTIPYSLNGGRTSGNNYMVDGADNVDRGSNLTLLTYPSVDAIAEFRASRSGYSAENGRAAAGQINVITRSGTSSFHGTLYEFVRNEKFAANNWFNNANRVNPGPDGTARRPPLRYNNFGGTIGGPVYIPGHYNRDRNRTFFFYSQEFRRVITYSTPSAVVPTADMKRGVFSQPVCVEYTGATCTASASTIANINPVARAYIDAIWSKIPEPTSGNSLFSSFRNVANARQELIRLDHSFSDRVRGFVRYEHDAIPTEEPGGLFTGSTLPGVASTKTDSPGSSIVARVTVSATPTLYNEAGYAYSYGAIESDPTGLAGSAYSAIKVKLPYASTLARVPTLSFTSGVSGIGGYGPYRDYNRNYNFYDNVAKIRGGHTLKAGFTFNYYQKTENAAGNNVGSFSFSNTPRPAGVAASGTMSILQSWANFLLGNVATFTQASLDLTPDMRQKQWETYFQDDWRVNRSLTVNLGVRYSMFYQPTDANHMLTTFDPAAWDPKKAPQVDTVTGNIIPNTGDVLNGIIQNGINSPYGNAVASNGHGNWAPRFGFAWDPLKKGTTAIRGGYGIAFDSTLVGIFEQNIFNNPPYVSSVTIPNTRLEDAAAGVPSISLAPKVLRGTPSPAMTPYTQQWSFDVQQQFGRDTIVAVGYYGSKSTHLLGIVDLNQLRAGAAVAAGITDALTPLSGSNPVRLNAIRPYRGYLAINTLENWFNSNYHSLQVSTQRKFSGSSSVRLSYTWSKTLTDATSDRSNAPQYTYARYLDYARASFDRTHVATISYIYYLPFMKKSRGLGAGLVKDWQVSGIATFMTGLPLRVTSGLNLDWGGIGIIGSSASSPRPDLVANPNAGAPHTVQQWFNTAAFAAPPAGAVRPGNAAATTVIGAGQERFDLSLIRNVRVHEGVSLQLRFETFNTLNHANWGNPGLSLGTSTFGVITSAREPRRVQLGAKLRF